MTNAASSIGLPLSWSTRCADFAELTKPRIAVLVSMVVATAVSLASDAPQLLLILNVSLATAAVAGSASAFNQLWERQIDARMSRTANRPLPAGRLSGAEVAVFGTGLLFFGSLYLWLISDLRTTMLALLTWLLYVGVYTPLKRVTSWNTFVGAFPGAMPVLIGWTATGQPLDQRAWCLFGLVFFWQFPHFMAIAWRCQHQYREAGLRMVTGHDPTGRLPGWIAVTAALVVIPLSLLPCLHSGPTGIVAAILCSLGAWQLAWAIQFLIRCDDVTARRLLRVSVAYLPLVLLSLVAASFI